MLQSVSDPIDNYTMYLGPKFKDNYRMYYAM